MNQEALEALFQLFPEGMFDEPADLNDIIEKEGLEGVYPLLPEGMFESEEEFVETFGGQKKKILVYSNLAKLRMWRKYSLPKWTQEKLVLRDLLLDQFKTGLTILKDKHSLIIN